MVNCYIKEGQIELLRQYVKEESEQEAYKLLNHIQEKQRLSEIDTKHGKTKKI